MTNRIDFIAIGDEKIHCRGCETRIRFALQRMSPPMRARMRRRPGGSAGADVAAVMAPPPYRTLAQSPISSSSTPKRVARAKSALGPFAGLRVSTRAPLIASGIEDVAQLRTAIAADTIGLDGDITSNGFTRRRWTELRDWLSRQPS